MNENYAKNIGFEKASDWTKGAVNPALDGFLFIPNVNRYERLKQADIRFVKGEKSYVTLYLSDGKKLSVSTHLGNFRRYLDSQWFVQVSRSHIVNLRHIEAVTTRSIVVSDQVIPLTERYRSVLWERLPIVRLRSD